MWKNTDVPSSDTHPPANQTQCSYTALLHHVSLTCGRMQTYPCEIYHPPINLSGTEPYYTMSVWHVEAYRHTQVRCIPLLIAPSATEPYYTMSVWDVEECRNTQVRSTPPTNWTQCYRVLLHHVSLTCGRMQMYPGQMNTTLPIEPSATESTAPCQFDMWQNVDVPR